MKLFLSVTALCLSLTCAAADPRDRDYRSDEVRDIQERLVELKLVEAGRFEVDGIYGSGTRDAVRSFQRDHNLAPADGEAGPLTVEALFGEAEGGGQRQARGRCKNEEISSTGNARPIESWALKLAKKNWREEVRARYGEEWSNFDHAQVALSKCFESSVGGVPLKRCRIVATPCNPV